MIGARTVVDETLDGLGASDPAAIASRRDLRRLHRLMGTRRLLQRALCRDAWPAGRPLRLLELGAGDATLLLGVAQALAGRWPAVELTVLDRQDLVAPATVAAYAAVGWQVRRQVIDVADWIGSAGGPGTAWDAILVNLFLHHFADAPLRALLAAIAARTARLVAIEPRRAALAQVGSRLVGLVGANAVTRVDAVLSVRAGFRDRELSTLWPAGAGRWRLHECPAGLFSHCFDATRCPPTPGTTAAAKAADAQHA